MPGIRADGLSPMQRLGFYRTNVFGNYLEGLRATYRCVENLVGRGCFAYHAERFIRETPSRSGDLNRYGREFADFLARASHYRAAPLPAGCRAAGMAPRRECSTKPTHPALDLERLTQMPPERYADLRFALHPACRLLCSAYPVRRIWQVSQPDYQGDQAVALDEGGDHLLLRREGFDPVVEKVTAAEFALLRALGSWREPGRGFDGGPVPRCRNSTCRSACSAAWPMPRSAISHLAVEESMSAA